MKRQTKSATPPEVSPARKKTRFPTFNYREIRTQSEEKAHHMEEQSESK